ncbi:MAG: glycosyltransferase [Gammaproteobacteria bacterium]|nr:glycosyltransferase [Gammaproteobacteria bacterium]
MRTPEGSMDRHVSADLSVVIPCYCASATVERALLSVIDQTLPPRFVLLVEDNSPDEEATRKTLDTLVARYQGWNGIHLRVLLSAANEGAGMARNRAWDVVETRYIAFLDADDAWHPRKVEFQYNWMCAHKCYALTGHLTTLRGERDRVPDVKSDFGFRDVGRTDLLISNRFYTRTVMLDAHLPYRFADKRFSEDYLLWLEIVFDGRKACVLETPLAYSFKTAYGESGLSARLWAMERGELDNFDRLHAAGKISGPSLLFAKAFSCFKYGVRQLRTAIRRVPGTSHRNGRLGAK